MTVDFDKLASPFPPSLVSWRVGSMNKEKTSGMALAYIDARDVMRRLDDVCGPGGWQARYPHANGKTICEIGLRIGDEWVWKANGAGDTDIEAEKGAISDAFKRAAVMWGVGRYLYDLPSPWVKVNQFKQIDEGEFRKLESLLTKAAPTQSAPVKPADSPALATITAALKLCATPEAIENWIASDTNRVAFNALSDSEYDTLNSRIIRWREHVAKVAA
jgi:hypothetical protein